MTDKKHTRRARPSVKIDYDGDSPLMLILGIGFLLVSLSLFFSRNPGGRTPRTDRFEGREFVVAFLFPGFYIPYAIIQGPHPHQGVPVPEGYDDSSHPLYLVDVRIRKNVTDRLFQSVGTFLLIWALVLWFYRTGYTTGWAWGETNVLGFLGAVFFPIIYIPYTYIDPITSYPRYDEMVKVIVVTKKKKTTKPLFKNRPKTSLKKPRRS